MRYAAATDRAPLAIAVGSLGLAVALVFAGAGPAHPAEFKVGLSDLQPISVLGEVGLHVRVPITGMELVWT